MLRVFLAGQLTAMERRFDYDASYLREVLAVSPWAFLRFGLVASLGRGRRAPREALAAASLVGTIAEDCGPCTQIGVDMALASGVSRAVLRAILSGDLKAMGETAALAWDFARASLARDLDRSDARRAEIVRRWGKAALVDIALALTTARMYPTLKYALGHGRACSRIVVAGEASPVAREVLAA